MPHPAHAAAPRMIYHHPNQLTMPSSPVPLEVEGLVGLSTG